MITVQTLIDSLKKELGSNYSTEAHRDPDIIRYINSAINYVWNFRDWTWSKQVYTFVYGTANAEVTIPYCLKVFGVKKNGEVQGVMNSEQWFLNDNHEQTVGMYGDKFISETTGTYQILYTPTAQRIADTADTIDMPSNFEDVLRILAVSFAYKDIKKYDKSSPLIGEANGFLQGIADRVSVPLPNNDLRLGSNNSWK